MKYLGIKRHDSSNNSQMVQERCLLDVLVFVCVGRKRNMARWYSEFD